MSEVKDARPRLELGAAPACLSCLLPRNAPPPFAAAVTHKAISQLLQTDLSEFKKLPEQEEEEEEEKALVPREFLSDVSETV